MSLHAGQTSQIAFFSFSAGTANGSTTMTSFIWFQRTRFGLMIVTLFCHCFRTVETVGGKAEDRYHRCMP
jgi:hypothetical protein